MSKPIVQPSFSIPWMCACILLFSISGCTFRQTKRDEVPEYQVEVHVSPDPAMVGSATLDIQISSEEGTPVDSIVLDIRGDMTHAGMTPVIEQAHSEGDGMYHAEFEWTMAGSWIVTLNGVLPDGRKLIRTFPIEVATTSP
jgi:hypothetical protein